MRKIFGILIVAAVVLCLVAVALAEVRNHDEKKLPFGGSFHKSPAGVSLNYLTAKWDEHGLNTLKYQIAAFRGEVTLHDVWVLDGGQIVYKRSKDKNVEMDFSFLDNTKAKSFFDNGYYATPIAPFDYETGEIWWVCSYVDNGATKKIVIVWKMSDNSIDWKPLKD